MRYPKITVIAGLDVKNIVNILINANVDYEIKSDNLQRKTKLFIESYGWVNEIQTCVYLKDIQKGLNLSFFKPKPSKLSWNIIQYISENWSFNDWEININDDLNCWDCMDFNLALSDNEILLLNTIINNRIVWENETLKIYNKVLIPIFKHPDIQNLLYLCACRKFLHVKIWCHAKEKFKLFNSTNLPYVANKVPAKTLENMVNDLATIIGIEEILKPAATKCLTHFIDKGHLGQFIKLVQRRDKESNEHAQVLLILLEQIEKIYPFLKPSITYSLNFKKCCAVFRNECLEKIQFSNIL